MGGQGEGLDVFFVTSMINPSRINVQLLFGKLSVIDRRRDSEEQLILMKAFCQSVPRTTPPTSLAQDRLAERGAGCGCRTVAGRSITESFGP